MSEQRKRFGQPRKQDGVLKCAYGNLRGELDLIYSWGAGVPKADSKLLHWAFAGKRLSIMDGRTLDPSFIEELEKRGYDITTFKFSIKLKQQPNPPTP